MAGFGIFAAQIIFGINIVLALLAAAWLAEKFIPRESDAKRIEKGEAIDDKGCCLQAAVFVALAIVLCGFVVIGFRTIAT